MEAISVQLKSVAVIAVVGALIETFIPGLISETLKKDFISITVGLLGILFSFLFLMWFLKLRIREGFEDTDFIQRWKTMADEHKIADVCSLYKDIYEKVMAVEKGIPPAEQKTDAQAREATDAQFAKVMTVKPVSCAQIDELNALTHIDSFYQTITSVPQTVLIQVYETAVACRTLLIENYLQVKDAETKRKEGFVDTALCGDAQAEERRQFLKRQPLSKEAETCRLVEEIPKDQKEVVMRTRLDQIQSAFETYKKTKPIKDSITKVLDDCKYYKEELDKKKKEAEATSAKYNW